MSEHEVRLPPRPMIPPVLWVFVATWSSQRVVARWGFGATQNDLMAVAKVAGLIWLVAIARVLWRGTRLHKVQMGACAAVLAVAASGALSAALVGFQQGCCVEVLQSRAMSSVEFIVDSDPSATLNGYRYRARVLVDSKTIGDVWLSTNERIMRGTAIDCVGRYKPLEDDEYGHSSWTQGICGSVLVVRILRVRPPRGPLAAVRAFRSRVLQAIGAQGSKERALLAGCVCGSREALVTYGIDEEFSTCGMAHVIAVSGAHLAVATALLARALERTGWSVRKRLLTLALSSGLYVVFCGVPASALRAWLMMLAAFGSQVAGRRTHALSSVCVVATLIILVSPQTGLQMGFELSVLSVTGLCLLSPYAKYVLNVALPSPKLPRRAGHATRRAVYALLDAAREILSATLVCQLVTLPVTAPTFGRVSLVAPLANLLVAPLVTPLIACGLLACLLTPFPRICSAFLALCDIVSCVMLRVVGRLSLLPYAYLPADRGSVWITFLTVIPIACLVVWPRLRRVHLMRAAGCMVVALSLLLMRWRYFAPAHVVVLDIGQGDAILVQDGASTVLIDAGPDDLVVEALARWHVLHLDAVVLTHLHDDHYGGIEYLRGFVPCERVVVARGVREAMGDEVAAWCRDLTNKDPTELSYGDTLNVGGYRLRMIWPHGEVDGSENAHSMELSVTYVDRGRSLSALLTGDAERDETGTCIERGDIGDIDLLKVGHHGSEVSLTSDEAGILDPEVSVASAGEGNSYGHPSDACVNILEGAGSTFLCTKDVGDVEVCPGCDGPVVHIQKSDEDLRNDF